MGYRRGVRLALQGEPTHRFFLPGQRSELARLACQPDTSTTSRAAIISRYFFYSNISEFGCHPRYFTMVSLGFINIFYHLALSF